MNLIVHLTDEPWVQRLGWVLVHFLWQGTIIGFVAGAARLLLRSVSAHSRYLVLAASLLLCGAAPCVTWIVLAPTVVHAAVARPASPSSGIAPVLQQPSKLDPVEIIAPSAGGIGPAVTPQSFDFMDEVEAATPYLALFWVAGVVLLSLRLAYGWMDLRRLRTTGTPVTDSAWTESLENLMQRLGVKRAVLFLESTRVEVPTVLGWLKPTLIVPATFLSSLPYNQVEAILAHELAHIRRNDYFFNLLQVAIETLLFYHPAVWWISRAVREERENCCDDLALKVSENAFTYASALAALEESRSPAMAITLAASGGSLADRIRRLTGGKAPVRSHSAPLVIALVALVLTIAGAYRSIAQENTSDDPLAGVDLKKVTIDQSRTFAMVFRQAVVDDRLDVVEAYLKHGMDVNPNVLMSGQDDILGDAAYFTHDPKMVQLLLDHGAKPMGAKDAYNSSVNTAARSGNKQITDMLIAAGGLKEFIRYDGGLGQLDDLKAHDAQQPLTPQQLSKALDYSVFGNQIAVFDWLWPKVRTNNPDADTKALNKQYSEAADWGSLEMMLHLEQMGVKVADAGPEALASAAGRGKVAVVKHLLDAGVPVKDNPQWGRSMLGEAAGEGHIEIVRMLLDHGANINAKDSEGMTPLSWAAYSSNDEICQLLIQRGADLTIPDKYDRTAPWYLACSMHSPGALQLAVQKGVNVTTPDKNGRSLLEYSLCFVPPDTTRIGFGGKQLTAQGYKDWEAREEKTIDLLIQAGMDPNGKEGKQTPLMTALEHNHYPAARALLRHGVNIKIKDADGSTALGYIFNWAHLSYFPLDVLQTMLEMGADSNESHEVRGTFTRRTADGHDVPLPKPHTTILAEAIRIPYPVTENKMAQQRAAVKLLLDHGAKFDSVANDNDQLVLQAAARGDLEKLQDAVTKGGSINAKSGQTFNPLYISMNLGYFDNAVWLIGQGADPNAASALAAAVHANRRDLVKLMLDKGVKVAQGGSGLGYAVDNGNQEMFDLLISSGARAADADLFGCIQNGRVQMARVLLDRGVDPQPKNNSEIRYNVYWAVYYDQPEILQMLLDHKADPTIVDFYKETPLSMAKQKNNKQMTASLEEAIKQWDARPHDAGATNAVQTPAQ